MSYNGSGTFTINTTGQPVVAGTVISSSAFNSLTNDLATGLTTAITKDGQTTTTARITFAQGVTSSLVTDSSSVSTGSIITAGGVGVAKKLYVGSTANIAGKLTVTGFVLQSGQNYSAQFSDGVYSTYSITHSSGLTNLITDAAMAFYTSNTERTRITTDGRFYVNQTAGNGNTAQRMGVTYDGATEWAFAIQTTSAAGGNSLSFQNSSGTQIGFINQTNTATSYSTSSDYRLKKDIVPMTGALAKVALLKPVTYKWKSDGSDGEGFIAHELQAVKPDCVSGNKDATRQEEYEVTLAVKDEEGNITTPAVMGTRTVPVYQGIDTSFLVATLTAAIQEQQTTITALTARITALENA